MTPHTSTPAPARTAELAAVIERAHRGERLEHDDVAALLAARGDDLEMVLDAASALRDASGRGPVITYSRKVFVPLTTLCRDRCHYCVFVDTPGQLLAKAKPVFMSPEQVLAVVRAGQRQGCKEALLTLGDRPEDRWPQARAWLDENGFASTLDYVGHIARLITAETGMLAHLNPGVMSAEELRMLRPTAPSMGMMLETTARELFEQPGQVHYGSPDKDPAVRLQVIEDAGQARIPFTTGILVGIGESEADRAESLLALRDSHARHGHVQEVIVQNFRAKPGTAMRDAPDADLLTYIATVAAARLVMGASMRIQVPPNLSDPAELALLLRAGADDWGGVSPLTADHVNPERPWPHLDDLAAHTRASGFTLTERLTAHAGYVNAADAWIDPALHDAVRALADPDTGLAHAGASAPHRPTTTGRAGDTFAQIVAAATEDPASVSLADGVRMLHATGTDLDTLVAAADDARRYSVGEAISIVVNRNLTSAGLRPENSDEPGTFTLVDVEAIARDAVDLGATELCVQGVIPGDPDGYLDLVHAVRRVAPGIHLHAYRPQDVWDFALRTGRSIDQAYAALRAAGVDTVPGTGVKVLDERIRARVAPTDLGVADWLTAIRAAHGAGLRSTSVLFYGHVESAADRVAHLLALRSLQAETGGFTEFVPMPLPGYGVPLVAGRTPLDEHRAMTAVARLMLAGSVPHIQAPWPRVGVQTARMLLSAGADDLGGTLLDGRVLPEAGIEHGQHLLLGEAAKLAAGLFRPLRQRTTDYRDASSAR